MIIQFLIGVLVAAGVFAALLWSIYQSILSRGNLQYAHISAVAFVLLGMASVSMVSPFLAQISGGLLLIAAAFAVFLESGWNRAFPVLQLIFAITLILGLPFAAA